MKMMKKLVAIGLMAVMLGLNVAQVYAADYTTIEIGKDMELEVSVGTMKSIEKTGVLSDITIREVEPGSLTENKSSSLRTVTLSLEGTNYQFSSENVDVTLGGGFSGLSVKKVEYGETNNIENKQILNIVLPHDEDITKVGTIRIKNVAVESSKLTTGALKLEICTPDNSGEKVKVAQIKSHSITVESTASKEVSLAAGDSVNIGFTIEEDLADTLVTGRDITVTLKNAYFTEGIKQNTLEIGSVYLNNKNITRSVEIMPITKDGYITGFEFTVPQIDKDVCNNFEFKGVSIYTLPEVSGDVELTIDTKDIQEAQTLTIASIDEPITVKTTSITAKVGEKGQTGGKIIISENGKGKINKGYIKIRIAGENYINFRSEPDIEVIEGDLEVKSMGWDESDGNVLVLKVTGTSTEASAIVISDFKFNVDTMAPDGSFSIFLSGNAIAPETREEEMEYKGFITTSLTGGNTTSNTTTNSGTLNSEFTSSTDDTEGIVTKFVVGSKIYEVDGKKSVMEAEPYTENGRTMVPIRYAVEAAGISQDDVKYKSGIITISAGETEIVMVLGSNIVSVNNEAKTMVTAPVSKNGRTYVPVSEIANILGLKVSWNGTTQTATFVR